MSAPDAPSATTSASPAAARVTTSPTSVDAAALPSLSAVLPTYNEAGWLADTVEALRVAVAEAGWPGVELLVVDDGSTDDTAAVLRTLSGPAADDASPGGPVDGLTVRHLRQDNAGRLAARRRGLGEATGELVLFLDSRVHLHPSSLAFVATQLREHPDRRIWNGHAVTASTSAPWTRFWDAITFLAWRRYLRAPRTTSYGAEEFEWFPKGTTCFMAPREQLIDATDRVESRSADPHLANDDTLMIRNLLDFGRINISPEFACTYHPRSTLRAFLRNAYHRGSVLVDGHLRPGQRFHRLFLVLAVAAPVVGLPMLRRPRRFAVASAGASVGAGAAAAAAGVPVRDAASFGALLVPFSVAYGAGIVRGFRNRVR
ncbi:MAG: glycosyltransferase family 2 protein [Microthrixaceae bacterium]